MRLHHFNMSIDDWVIYLDARFPPQAFSATDLGDLVTEEAIEVDQLPRKAAQSFLAYLNIEG
jgi:hypothetical protein